MQLFFTSHTGGLGYSALPFLCLLNAGLWGAEGRLGDQAVDLLKGHADSRLRALLKAASFILLHTGTPLAPLAQFALHNRLSWSKTSTSTNTVNKAQVQCFTIVSLPSISIFFPMAEPFISI